MSRREDIETAVWNDSDFFALSGPAKLIYIWSFTNDRTGMAGLYMVPQAAIVMETGHDEDTVTAALAELQQRRFLFYDGTWMWVRARVKRLNTRTVQMCKAVAKQVAKIPADHPYREGLLEQDGSYVWRSRDEVTTLNAEVSGHTTDPHGTHTGPSSSFALESQNKGPTPIPPERYRGNGRGRGRGEGQGGLTDTRARHERAIAWAQEHLPDLPADFVATAYSSMQGDRTPERVRARVLSAYPSLREDAA